MLGNSPQEATLPKAENGPFQWLTLIFVAWALTEAIRYVWLHAV
jgi:hypothetical protein